MPEPIVLVISLKRRAAMTSIVRVSTTPRGGGGGWNLRHDHYISKENNPLSNEKIRYIWGLEGPNLILLSEPGPH